VTADPAYIAAIPNVRAELAVPLISKNRVIGVIDLEAREPGYLAKSIAACSRCGFAHRGWN